MSKGEDDGTLSKIRRRWDGASLLLAWHEMPRARRERVLAELEESARGLGDADRQLAADLTTALDVLDREDASPLLELLKQAQSNIRELL